MHPDEIAVSADVVWELIDAQFRQWRDLPVRRISSTGTVNAIFRVGDELAARFPLRRADPGEVLATLQREVLAAAELARHSRIPTPRPVAIGAPGSGYPLPWSVQTWLPGTVATEADPGESVAFAEDLADFIADLRNVDTRDLPRVAPDVMSHGDLIPGNMLVADGRLAGILDAGGFGPADPALDLVAGWHLLGNGPRTVLRERLGCDDLEWARGRAWAFEQSMGAVWYYVASNPTMSLMGRRTLERILAGAGPR